MACYTEWNLYLKPGTPEYAKAEAKVRAKLRTIQHIIDYYYRAYEYQKPSLPEGTPIDSQRQPKSRREQEIREAICHHFACDGVGVSDLYDASTLLDASRQGDCSYLAVILPCASLIRQSSEKYIGAYK